MNTFTFVANQFRVSDLMRNAQGHIYIHDDRVREEMAHSRQHSTGERRLMNLMVLANICARMGDAALACKALIEAKEKGTELLGNHLDDIVRRAATYYEEYIEELRTPGHSSEIHLALLMAIDEAGEDFAQPWLANLLLQVTAQLQQVLQAEVPELGRFRFGVAY